MCNWLTFLGNHIQINIPHTLFKIVNVNDVVELIVIKTDQYFSMKDLLTVPPRVNVTFLFEVTVCLCLSVSLPYNIYIYYSEREREREATSQLFSLLWCETNVVSSRRWSCTSWIVRCPSQSLTNRYSSLRKFKVMHIYRCSNVFFLNKCLFLSPSSCAPSGDHDTNFN